MPAEGKEVEVRTDHEQNYKDQRKKLTGQLTQVTPELSTLKMLKASLDKMGKVVLDHGGEAPFLHKKEAIDGQQKFPRQPEDNHEELASQLQKAVASISEKLKPQKKGARSAQEVGSRECLKGKVLQRRNSLGSQPSKSGHLALTLDESLLAVWKTRSICRVPPRVASTTTTCDFCPQLIRFAATCWQACLQKASGKD